MFDKALKTSKPLWAAMDAATFACKHSGLKIMDKSITDKKFRITAKERLNILNKNYCGITLNILGFKIEDDALVMVSADCIISSIGQETLAKGILNSYTKYLENHLNTN